MPDLQSLLQQIRVARPDLFTNEDLDNPTDRFLPENMRAMAQERRFGSDDINPFTVIKQAVSGFISGFTALPSMAEPPQSPAEDIAFGLGHLGGFVGLFPGLGTVGGLASKGITGGARMLGVAGAKFGARGFLGMERALAESAHGLGLLSSPVSRFRSAPLMIADFAVNKLEAMGPIQAAKLYLEKGAGGRLISSAIGQGTQLGIASAVSSANYVIFSERNLKDTVKDAMNAAAYGAVFGGVFGGGVAATWKIPWMSKPTTMAALGRAIAGSLAQGLPSTIEGRETHMQIYEYIMGGVFGLHTPSAETHLAARALHRYSNDPLEQYKFNLHKDPTPENPKGIDFREASGYNALPKEVQVQVDGILDRMNRPVTTGVALFDILEAFNRNVNRVKFEDIPSAEVLSSRLSSPFKGKNGDRVVAEHYFHKVTGEMQSPIGTAVRVSGDGMSVVVRFDDGEKITLPNYRVRLLAEAKPGDGTKPEDIATSEQNDMEPLAARIGGGALRRGAVARIGREDIMESDVENFTRAYDAIVSMPETANGYRTDIKDLLFKGRDEKALMPEEKEILDNLVQLYHVRKWGVKRQVGHYDLERGFILDVPLSGSEVVFDMDNNRSSVVGPGEYREDLATLTWVHDRSASKAVQSFKEFPMSLAHLGHLFQSAWVQGWLPVSGRADHAEIKFGKPNWTGDMAGEWTRISGAMKRADPDHDSYYAAIRARDATFGFTEDQTRAIMISRARDLEKFFFGDYDPSGKNLERLLTPDPPVKFSMPADMDGFRGMYPDVDFSKPSLSEAQFKGETGGEDWAQEFKGGKWVGSSLTKRARVPGPSLFPGYGHWLMYKAERLSVEKMISPVEGEHSADYVEKISRLGYERMLAKTSDRVSGRGYIPNLAALNKRTQLIDHRFYTGDPNVLSPEERAQLSTARVMIIHDPMDNAISRDHRRVNSGYSDGSAWTPQWMIKLLNRMSGHKETEGHSKVFIQQRDPVLSTGLYKPLLQPYSTTMEAGLKKEFGSGIILMPLTSAKAYGGRKAYHLHTLGDKIYLFDEAGNRVLEPETYPLNPQDIGIAFSVKDPDVSNRVQLSKSIVSVWKRFQVGLEADEDAKRMIDTSILGTEEANKALREYIKDPTKENLEALDPFFLDMDKKLLLSQIKNDDKLMAGLLRRMVFMKDEYVGEGDDTVEWDTMIKEAYGDKRWVGLTGGDPKLLATNKATKDLMENTVTKFLLGSMTRPWVNGSKSFVALFDPMEVRNIDIGDLQDKIYYTRNWRNRPWDGIGMDGKPARMKLKEQLAIRERLGKEQPLAWEKTLVKIDNALRMIVERDPMDNATGLVSLRIGGFVDRPGNGAFMAGELFRQLSGMDGDGDTINSYANMPPSWHAAAREMTGMFERMQLQYPKGENLWYKKDNPDIKMSGLPSAMLDPVAAIQVGLEVSKGRGFLIGWHTAMMRSVLTLMDNAREDGTYFSPIYYDRRERTGTNVRFAVKADGVAAAKLMADGAHVFVDVAKKGLLLPSKEDIAMYNLAAGFDAIFVDRGPKSKRTYMINLVNAISKDGGEWILDAENTAKLRSFIDNEMWKTDIGLIREANRKFYRNNLLERRPYSFNEVTDAAARYPAQIQDLLGTIAYNMRGLNYSEGILNRVLPYYPSFLGNARMWDQQMMQDTEKKQLFPFLKRNYAPQFEAMLSRLSLIQLHYQPELADQPGNWATERGLAQYVRSGSRTPGGKMRLTFKELFRITAKEHEKRFLLDEKHHRVTGSRDSGYSMQDYLQHLAKNVMAGASNKWYALDDAERAMLSGIFQKKVHGIVRRKTISELTEPELDRAMDILFDSKAMGETLWKMRYLKSYVDQVEDFLSSRFRDMAGVEGMFRVYARNKITPEISLFVTRKISQIKQDYGLWHSRKHYEGKVEKWSRKGEWTPELVKATMDYYDERSELMHKELGTPEAVQRQVDDLLTTIRLKMETAEKRGKKMPEFEKVKEYVYTVLASSLDPYTGKTRHYQRIDEIIPAKVMKETLEMQGKLFSSFEKPSKPEDFKKFWDDIRGTMPGHVESVRQYKDYNAYTHILMPEVKPGEKLDAKTATMVHEIVDILKGIPQLTDAEPEQVLEVLRFITSKAQPKDMMYPDIVGLRHTLVGAKIGPGMIRWLMHGGPDKWRAVAERWKDGRPMGPMDRLGFIATTAQSAMMNDMILLDKRIFPAGGETEKTTGADLSAERIAFPTIGHNKIDYVYGNSAKPISHLYQLVEVNRMATIAPEQVKSMDEKEYARRMGWSLRIMDENNVDRHKELHELAVREMELEGAKLTLRTMIREDDPEKYDKKMADVAEYQRRNLEAKETWKKYQNRVFNMPMNPGKPTATGAEVQQMLRTAIEGMMKDYAFMVKIAATPEQIAKYIQMGKNQRVNVPLMLRKINALVREQQVREQLPADIVRMMEYFDIADMTAKDGAADVAVPTRSAVENMQFGVMREMNSVFKDFAHNVPEARIWISMYLKRVYDPEGRIDISKIREPGIRDAATRGLKAAQDEMDRSGAEGAKDRNKSQNTMLVWQAKDYLRKTLKNDQGPQSDVRFMTFGWREYSQYEMDRKLALKELSPEDWLYHRTLDEKSYSNTGEVDGYWPHLAWYEPTLERSVRERADLIKNSSMTKSVKEQRLAEMVKEENRRRGMGMDLDGMEGTEALAAMQKEIGSKSKIARSLDLTASLSPNQLHRQYNLDGYSYKPEAAMMYFDRLNRATYKRLALMINRNIIHDFEKKAPMGVHTKEWADYMRIYVRTAMGGPSLYTEEMLADPRAKTRDIPYYYMSDQFWGMKGMKIYTTWLRLSGANLVTEPERALFEVQKGRAMTSEDESSLTRKKIKAMTEPTEENLLRASRLLHNFSLFEGRYEMATLLAHSKTGVSNVLGGTVGDWVWNGARSMLEAWSMKTWRDISPIGPDGTPEWKTRSDVKKAFYTQGIIEDYITHEGSMVSDKKGDWKGFAKDMGQMLSKDPDAPEGHVRDLLKKNNISESVYSTAGWFMKITERELRINTGLAAYLNMRRAMMPMANLEWNNPHLLDAMKKGIASSQFLYGAETRPVWAATNAGKVYSRFKLWAWSSVKYRRQVFEEARNAGYSPGTVQFDRLQRMMTADLFMIGLASLLPYTILDYGLPAPLSYFQNLQDWLTGDDRKRERAYFISNIIPPGEVSKIIAPLNELMPVIARWPKGMYDLPNTFAVIWGGDLNKLGEYTTYSLFPFGRLSKDVARSLDNPSFMVDIMVGVPFKRLGQVKTRLAREQKRQPGPHTPFDAGLF